MLWQRKHSRLSALALGLACFLLFFSAFALFHAYAYDELIDPHGCQIGQWVQNGQVVVAAVLSLSMALLVLGADVRPPVDLFSRLLGCRLLARAPPLALR